MKKPWICQRCGEALAENDRGEPLHHRKSPTDWTCTQPALVPFFNMPWACSREADDGQGYRFQ